MSSSELTNSSEDKSPGSSCAHTFKVKEDWYQSETHVVINILVKNLKNEDVSILFDDQSLTVDLKLPGKATCFMYKLSHPIDPSQSSHKVLSSKIELKLKKVDDIRWEKLETETGPHPSENKKPQPKNWDKVAATAETEEDKPQGEAALNALFQQIYGEGSDDVRRAMNKSFVESGGTVLSTQWSDVKQKTVEVKPLMALNIANGMINHCYGLMIIGWELEECTAHLFLTTETNMPPVFYHHFVAQIVSHWI